MPWDRSRSPPERLANGSTTTELIGTVAFAAGVRSSHATTATATSPAATSGLQTCQRAIDAGRAPVSLSGARRRLSHGWGWRVGRHQARFEPQGMRQPALHRTGTRIPALRRGLEGALHHVDEPLGQVGTQVVQPSPACRLVRVPKLEQRSRRVRVGARDQMEQEDAQAVQVADRRGVEPGEDFRRQVHGRAGDRRIADLLLVVEEQPRAEVHQNDAPAFLPDDVLRLDVAMDQTRSVHGRERAAQILPDEGSFAPAKWTLSFEQLLERAASDELHPQPDTVAMGLDAVNGDDVPVVHAGQEPAFVQDLRGQQIRRPGSGPQQLDGDIAPERLVERPEDFAVHAGAHPLEQRQVSPAFGFGGCGDR